MGGGASGDLTPAQVEALVHQATNTEAPNSCNKYLGDLEYETLLQGVLDCEEMYLQLFRASDDTAGKGLHMGKKISHFENARERAEDLNSSLKRLSRRLELLVNYRTDRQTDLLYEFWTQYAACKRTGALDLLLHQLEEVRQVQLEKETLVSRVNAAERKNRDARDTLRRLEVKLLNEVSTVLPNAIASIHARMKDLDLSIAKA